MNPVYYLYFAVFIFLIALLILVLFHRKPKRKQSIQADYISGLHALIDGDKEKALDRLRQVVRRDTEYIDAYILIGNIFRDKGAYENAIKVHRDLLVRPNLSVDHQRTILMNLAMDYKKNGQPKWALSTCDKIIEIERKNEWARDFKIHVYEDMGDWQGAYDILKKNNVRDKTQKNARLAAYRVEQGLQLVSLKQEHDARVRFREAIRQDPNCYAAYVELVHSYIRDSRPKDAVKELKRLAQEVPQYADIAVREFEEFLFDMGEFSEIENLYKQLLNNHPELTMAYLALAELYEKKGELVRASEFGRKVLKYDPNNPKVLLFLIGIENKLRRYDSSAQLASQMATQFLDKKYAFKCTACDNIADKYFYRCPSCAAWNTAERV